MPVFALAAKECCRLHPVIDKKMGWIYRNPHVVANLDRPFQGLPGVNALSSLLLIQPILDRGKGLPDNTPAQRI